MSVSTLPTSAATPASSAQSQVQNAQAQNANAASGSKRAHFHHGHHRPAAQTAPSQQADQVSSAGTLDVTV